MKLSYRNALTLLLISSVSVLISAGRTWSKVWYEDPGMPVVDVTLSGNQLEPLISGLAAASIAAVLGIMAARGVVRRIFGGVVVALGIGILYSSLRVKSTIGSHVAPAIAEAVGRDVANYEFSFNNLVWVSILGGLGIIFSGLAVLTRDFSSAKLSSKYDRKRPTDAELSPWQSLDSGIDPTIEGS